MLCLGTDDDILPNNKFWATEQSKLVGEKTGRISRQRIRRSSEGNLHCFGICKDALCGGFHSRAD